MEDLGDLLKDTWFLLIVKTQELAANLVLVTYIFFFLHFYTFTFPFILHNVKCCNFFSLLFVWLFTCLFDYFVCLIIATYSERQFVKSLVEGGTLQIHPAAGGKSLKVTTFSLFNFCS
jgi:hypothetical protein